MERLHLVGREILKEATATDINLAGGSQGSVVLFTPSDTETESARTIFDPITSIAPAWDCQTYAVGCAIFVTPWACPY